MQPHKHVITLLFVPLFWLFSHAAHAIDVAKYPALQELVKVMTTEDGFPKDDLMAILREARLEPSIIAAMNKQYESLPWHKYKKRFINDRRINDGVTFWREHYDTLQRAEQEYGVPMRVLVALIGVETHYGQNKGNKRVLDGLVTLTADFPRRSKFFGKELRTFLNTTRKEGIAADSVLGSFAGAIGIPQFMPTSYNAYSVDFDKDGKRDLVNSYEDAIGSVANYLSVHGWKRGQIIYQSTRGVTQNALELVTKRAKPTHNQQTLIDAGVVFDEGQTDGKVALLSLTQTDGKTYIVGHRNLYAITRYNPSVNYAMAISLLSEEIDQLYGK